MAEVYENYFFTWHLTDEDKAKTMQYQQERERRKERESAVSYEDYLRSLQTTIRLAPVNDNTRERAVQLMNKTNQFNTCTLRMDELALEHYLGEEGGHLLMAEVSDKYGNSGWVSEFLYHQDGDTAVIDNFLMSCRVMGRKVEDAILDAVLKKLQADGITRATAAYKKTARTSRLRRCGSNWDLHRFPGMRSRSSTSESLPRFLRQSRFILWSGMCKIVS